jgi:flagellar P-ring protein precursor FlgI
MTRRSLRIIVALCSAVSALCAAPAHATRVHDLVDIKGEEPNVLTGLGLVSGLNGTGDKSKGGAATLRPLARWLENLGNPVPDLSELEKVDTIALVHVTLEVPRGGAREGSPFDVRVSAINNATSLAGGVLEAAFLRPPGPDSADLPVLAMASGQVLIEGENPRTGRVREGGQLLGDVITNPVIGDRMFLVLKKPWRDWSVAQRIAEVINAEFEAFGEQAFTDVARVLDLQTIRLRLPEPYRQRHPEFIASVLSLHVDTSLLELPAVVVVNEKAGIIAVTGNVLIGPVAITHADLSISMITPEPNPTPQDPKIETRRWQGLDTTATSERNRTSLRALLDALEGLDVSAKDQIAILYELQRTGALYGEIRAE